MKNGIVTRAVLYDIARLKSVPYLAPGDRIFPEDMEAWERQAGVRVGPGDALVLRWGRYGRRAKLGPEEGAAGFDNSILPWLKQRDVALIVWKPPLIRRSPRVICSETPFTISSRRSSVSMCSTAPTWRR